MEIKFNSLQQATIGVSGSDITYECTGNANISGNVLNTFEGGNITKKGDGTHLATFSSFRDGQMSINFEVGSPEDWPNLIEVANTFLSDLREKVGTIDVSTMKI